MSFMDCLDEARNGGQVSPEEYAEVARRWREMLRAHSGDPAKAKEALAKALGEDAARKEMLAALTMDRQASVLDVMERYRDASGNANPVEAAMGVIENRNNTLVGGPDVVGRSDALLGQFHAGMERFLYDARLKMRGLGSRDQQTQALMSRVVDEAFEPGLGGAEASDFLKAWWNGIDVLMDRATAAGAVMERKARYIPQNWDARKMAAAGVDRFVADVMPLANVTAMRDPLTGQTPTRERLEEGLRVMFRRITTDGAIDRPPSFQPHGLGALANRRGDERYFQFATGEGWKQAAAAYGNPDLYAAMMNHAKGLARDVAALEVLGPNPDAMVNWMTMAAQQMAAEASEGLSRRASGRLDDGAYKIERLWQTVRGVGEGNQWWADVMSGVRSFLTGNNLAGAAVTAILSDPFQQANARRFAGVPAMRAFHETVGHLISAMTQGVSDRAESTVRQATRAGVIMEDALHHIRRDLRETTMADRFQETMKRFPERVFQWTGLTPWTRAGQRAASQSFMFHAGDLAEKTLGDIRASNVVNDQRFARWLEGFGVGDAEWELLRTVPRLDNGEAGGMLRPVDAFARAEATGDAALREAALRYSAALHGFVEEAVPQGTNRIKAAMGRDSKPGTFAGEGLRAATMYMSYPVNVTMNMLRAIARESSDGGLQRGLAFGGSAFVLLGMAGLFVVISRELRAGRDVPELDGKLMGRAIATGGGVGFIGDYLFADLERGTSETAARVGGPIAGMIGDALSIVDPQAFLAGDERNMPRILTRAGERYVPLQNMWYLRPLTQRAIWDQLRLMGDPDATRAWRRQERKRMNDDGQGTWWRRGEIAPQRAPGLPASGF